MGYPGSDLDPLDPFASREVAELELDLDAVPARAPTAITTGPQRTLHEEPAAAGPPARAIELADFGPPPPFYLAGPYAVGTLLRRRALREKLPELRRLRDAAARDLEAAALELGRAVHEARAHPRAGELGSALRRANAAEKLTRDHDASFEAARAEAQEKIARIEASIARAAEALRPDRARARELSAQIVVHQQRYEAEATKVQELGAALAALEREARPDPNRRIELEATRTLRKADADAALRELEALTPELTALEAKIAETDRTAEKGRAIIARTREALGETEARIEREAADGRATYEKALRELADEAVRLKLDREMVPPASKRARLRYDTYAAHERELEMHEVALTLYHPSSVKLGVVSLVLGAVGLVAGLGYLLVP